MLAVLQPNALLQHQPDVVKAAVQRVMHLVADYRRSVVLRRRRRKGASLLVRARMRRVGLGAGRRPQQGRGGDRGRRMLLPLDADGRRCGDA